MVTDPLGDLLSFAERTYVRMQAEQLILQCLQREDPGPFYDLVSELVVAGSPSLVILREVQDVVRFMKAELTKDGRSVRQALVEAMADFGVFLPRILFADTPDSFRRMCSRAFREDVRRQGSNLELEDVDLLEEICAEAGKKVTSIAGRMGILNQMESAVNDWLDGLAYEAAHEPDPLWERTFQPPHRH